MNDKQDRFAIPLFISLVLMLALAGPVLGGPSPIRVGATLSFEGKYAEPSEMIRFGYDMWVDQVNARGGLLGRPVELILYDDRSDLGRVGASYRTLIDKDRVDLLLSPYGSPATLIASQLAEKNRMVMIACAAGSESVYNRGFQFLFGLYAPADRFCIGFLDLLARQGLNRIGIVYEQSLFHESIYTGVRRWSEIFDIDIIFARGFSRTKAQFGSLVAGIKTQVADALIISSYPPEGYELLQSMQHHRFRPTALFMTITSIHPDFHKKAGGFADGVFGPSQWEPIESVPFPGSKKFVQDFKRLTDRSPSYHASAAFTACQILEQAVIQTQSLEHRKLRDYISRLDTITIIGRFKVDASGRQVGHNPMVIQWQKGRKEIVYPAKMKTAEPLIGK